MRREKMDLRKLPLPPPPCPPQPSPARLGSARPRGRWGLGGQDVLPEPGRAVGGGIKGAATVHSCGGDLYPDSCHPLAVFVTAFLPPLLRAEGSVHRDGGWDEKGKQLSPGKRLSGDIALPHDAGTPAHGGEVLR